MKKIKFLFNAVFIILIGSCSFNLHALRKNNDIAEQLDLENDDNGNDDNLPMPHQIGQMPESPNAFDSFNKENMVIGLNGAQDDFDSSIPAGFKNTRQDSPLMLAVLDNDMMQVENSLKNKKNIVDYKNKDGQTALHYAALRNDSQMVKLLVDNQALIDSADSLGRTPLHFASQNDSIAAAKILIEHQANPAIKDNDDKIPTDYALSKEMQDLL